jgi:Leucine-rich repeat (LRR) protein
MRVASFLLFVVSACASAQPADDTPSADEKKLIAEMKKLKAKASIDSNLPMSARVAVKFDTLNDALLATLAKQPLIGSIQGFDGTACTVKGFTQLQNLPGLRRLVLNKSGVTDKEIAAIAGCTGLRELVIPESTLTDAGLPDLLKLSKLEALDLSDNAKITDKSIAQLIKLERLEVLRLNKTGITDKGLMELKPLEGLRELSVGGSKVSQAAADKFVDEMPNLRVVRR